MTSALLLSGGMDSIAIAYWKRPEFAITIDYGQRPGAAEIRAATAAAHDLRIDHHIIRVDLRDLGSGDMAGASPSALAPVSEWWPYRNQMLITLAAMKGIALGIRRLLIGTLKTDESHADGRSDFINTSSRLLSLQEGALSLEAPAINLNGVELIKESMVPKEILAWAHSCHVSDYACGNCRGCRKHYETWAALGAQPY